ncbi:hypothetical protein BDF14DRAFT_1743727 [Spinellus fusiger]|nr:hypothetical protein BDF14DRAFT_1743727 [Spinellus fusiger]
MAETATLTLADQLAAIRAAICTLKQKTSQHDQILAKLSELTAENNHLHLEIASLKAQLSSQSSKKTVTPPQTDLTQIQTQSPPVFPHKTAKKTNIATNVPSYSKVAATPKSPTVCPPVAVHCVAAAACGFQIPTGAQGFQYIYIPCSHKMQHKEFASNIRELLEKVQVKILDNFDP